MSLLKIIITLTLVIACSKELNNATYGPSRHLSASSVSAMGIDVKPVQYFEARDDFKLFENRQIAKHYHPHFDEIAINSQIDLDLSERQTQSIQITRVDDTASGVFVGLRERLTKNHVFWHVVPRVKAGQVITIEIWDRNVFVRTHDDIVFEKLHESINELEYFVKVFGSTEMKLVKEKSEKLEPWMDAMSKVIYAFCILNGFIFMAMIIYTLIRRHLLRST